ncbi:hypothetical protein Bhyg_04038, partial [Pseudolycoriella hygida]
MPIYCGMYNHRNEWPTSFSNYIRATTSSMDGKNKKQEHKRLVPSAVSYLFLPGIPTLHSDHNNYCKSILWTKKNKAKHLKTSSMDISNEKLENYIFYDTTTSGMKLRSVDWQI